MRRRAFIAGLGGAAAWPVVTRAQGVRHTPRVIMLVPFAETDAEARAQIQVFRTGLAALGWREGETVSFEVHWLAGANIDNVVTQVTELKPDLILARTTPVTAAVLRHTKTIPVVFLNVSDPVGDRFVASLSRPRGKATGFTNVEASMVGKWLDLLRELAPNTRTVAALLNPKSEPGGGKYYVGLLEQAAKAASVSMRVMTVDTVADIKFAVTDLGLAKGSGLIVFPDVVTTGLRKDIVNLVAEARVPAVYAYRFIAAEGGLIAYGIDVNDIYARAASYADRILRGAAPEDLPVQAPVKFDLAINLKTARSLGLSVPPTLLARADEVIE